MADFIVSIQDTEFKVGLAEYGGYGPQGIQGPPGPPGETGPSGSSITNASEINVTLDGTPTNVQAAITQLSQLFFQQSSEPVVGINEGDLWFDTNLSVLKVYQNAVWVTVMAQPNLEVATLDAGYF